MLSIAAAGCYVHGYLRARLSRRVEGNNEQWPLGWPRFVVSRFAWCCAGAAFKQLDPTLLVPVDLKRANMCAPCFSRLLFALVWTHCSLLTAHCSLLFCNFICIARWRCLTLCSRRAFRIWTARTRRNRHKASIRS